MADHDRDESRSAICLSCGAIGDLKIRVQCKYCGARHDASTYDQLLAYARSVARFGYLYRRVYETLGTDRRYSIPLDDALVFMALAALSGVIGNHSDRVIRSLIRRVVGWARSRGPEARPPLPPLVQVPSDTAEVDGFIQLVADYYNGLPDLPPAIREAIFDEIVVDQAEAIIGESFIQKLVGATPDEIARTMFNAVAEARRAARLVAEPPPKDHFDTLWKNASSSD